METKFKVGDKVRVKSLEWYNNEPKDKYGIVRLGYGWEFIKDMVQYCGKVIKISRIYDGAYKVDDNPYHWQDWMLEDEPVTEEKQEVEQLNKNSMETKEMTKEQAREYLTQKKFCVSNITEARNVARFLKNLDIDILPCFMYGFTETLTPFYHETEDEYKEDDCEEITLQDILSIKIVEEEPEPKFDPKTLQTFDKVLVRQGKHSEWLARFFDFCEDDNYYTTSGSAWVMCIPYNEETKHLHGTAEEEPEFYKIWK